MAFMVDVRINRPINLKQNIIEWKHLETEILMVACIPMFDIRTAGDDPNLSISPAPPTHTNVQRDGVLSLNWKRNANANKRLSRPVDTFFLKHICCYMINQ